MCLTMLQNACRPALKGWDVKGGIHRMLVGGGHGEARQTLKDDRPIPKTTAGQ